MAGIVFFMPVSQRLLGFLAVFFEDFAASLLLAISQGVPLVDLISDTFRKDSRPLRSGGQSLDLAKAVVDRRVGEFGCFGHSFSLLLSCIPPIVVCQALSETTSQ